MFNLINNQLIICSSFYLSVIIFHFFTPKINQRRKINHLYPWNIHQFQFIPKNSSLIVRKKRPPQKHLSKLVDNNKTINLNIAFYFLNILASSDVLPWYTTRGTITKTIKNIGQTKNVWIAVERTWLMVNICKYMGVQYTRKILQSTLVDLTFKTNDINSIFLQLQWKTILVCATQPIWLTVTSSMKVSMHFLIKLLI